MTGVVDYAHTPFQSGPKQATKTTSAGLFRAFRLIPGFNSIKCCDLQGPKPWPCYQFIMIKFIELCIG